MAFLVVVLPYPVVVLPFLGVVRPFQMLLVEVLPLAFHVPWALGVRLDLRDQMEACLQVASQGAYLRGACLQAAYHLGDQTGVHLDRHDPSSCEEVVHLEPQEGGLRVACQEAFLFHLVVELLGKLLEVLPLRVHLVASSSLEQVHPHHEQAQQVQEAPE